MGCQARGRQCGDCNFRCPRNFPFAASSRDHKSCAFEAAGPPTTVRASRTHQPALQAQSRCQLSPSPCAPGQQRSATRGRCTSPTHRVAPLRSRDAGGRAARWCRRTSQCALGWSHKQEKSQPHHHALGRFHAQTRCRYVCIGCPRACATTCCAQYRRQREVAPSGLCTPAGFRARKCTRPMPPRGHLVW